MTRTLIAVLVVAAVTACGRVPPPQLVSTMPALPTDEQSIVRAIVGSAAESEDPDRPVLLLNETAVLVPPGLDVPPPPDFPEALWREQNPPLPSQLRVVDKRVFGLDASAVPARATLYSRQRFEHLSRSRRGLEALALETGKREPYVLHVARPFLDEHGTAHVLVHAATTWDGCGSISWYSATKENGAWVGAFKRVLVVW